MSEEKNHVIVVTEAGGREVRYRADWADSGDVGLDLILNEGSDGLAVVHYAPGYYKRAYREDAMLGDNGTKLRIAVAALRKLTDPGNSGEQVFEIASTALEDIKDAGL